MTSLQRVIKYCAVAFAAFLIVAIIGGICTAAGVVIGLLDRDKDIAGPMQTYEISGQIENLDLEIGAAELQIVSGDRFLVESNHKYLTVAEEKGTLKISEKKAFLGTSSKGVTVVLTVPGSFVFEDADIETGAGKVSISALSANTLSLDLGAGKTEIGNLNVLTRGSISTGAGEVIIRGGVLHDLSVDHGVGRLELTGRLVGDCGIDFGVGDAELNLLGSREDYRIKLDKGLGNATLDGEAMTDGSTYGSGDNRIDIDGGVGAIRIRFRELKTPTLE